MERKMNLHCEKCPIIEYCSAEKHQRENPSTLTITKSSDCPLYSSLVYYKTGVGLKRTIEKE
jgi:hypothetical protein